MCHIKLSIMFCDKCSLPLHDTVGYVQCDFCGDKYCDECDPHLDNTISFTDHGKVLDFCQLSCIEEYIHIIVNFPQ
jgi:hypothetical protein